MKMSYARLSGQNVRRGFSTMMVILTMFAISGAVVGMATLFARDVTRTRQARAQIQLRQLLIASIPAARQELATNGTRERDVPVTVPLEGAALVIHVAPAASGVEVKVSANYGAFKAAQTLTFSANYDLTSATLTQTRGQ